MSLDDLAIDHPLRTADETSTSVAVPVRRSQGLAAWALIACLMLVTSGVVRTIQERRHKSEINFIEACPFPLNSLPTRMGVWKMKPGSDNKLDDETMKITGGTDHIFRIYVDELTGVTLTVLILFGPAEPVMPHIPEVCYPASGFSTAQSSYNRTIPFVTQDAKGQNLPHEAVFRSSVYEKTGGLAIRREEAYHSFRLAGQWSPDFASGRKFPRRNPGVFKVQVQRLVAAGENRERDNPIDQFLTILIPEIERGVELSPKSNTVAVR